MNRNYNRLMIFFPFAVVSIAALMLALILIQQRYPYALMILLAFILLILTCLFMIRSGIAAQKHYIQQLSSVIDQGKEYAVNEFPIGVVVLDDKDHIEWTNRYMDERFKVSVIDSPVNEIFPNLLNQLKVSGVDETEVDYGEEKFRVAYSEEMNILYFFDITNAVHIQNLYEDEKPVVGMIFLDNYDEITQNMSDQARTEMNSMMTSLINRWAEENQVFVKRYSSDQFVMLMNHRILKKIEETKFNLLDTVRAHSREKKTHITLSIGVGEGVDNLITLGEMAQSSLDLALGRGGDQVAIKNAAGNARFYGGKTNPMEKRTRVRARVISHALKDILVEGDNVIIMGHKRPDMDAIGASIGVARFARMNNLKAYIVLNESDIDDTLSRVMSEIEAKPELEEIFVSSDEAWTLMTNRSTLVVVDTHKPEMVIDENILNKATRKVVIDHHRRGDSFISNPLLVYMEPYASSTAELVTELLEYQPDDHKITRLEATIMLAGIIVDTRNFTLRTGSRTFDAASYLRSHGADTILCQHFLKDDIDTYIKRSELIKTAELSLEGIAIAHGADNEIFHPVVVAQAADELLSINGVEASFVVARRSDDVIGISARSLGEINVQLVMEALGGGGHLSNAATQLKGVSVEEAISELKAAILQFTRSEA